MIRRRVRGIRPDGWSAGCCAAGLSGSWATEPRSYGATRAPPPLVRHRHPRLTRRRRGSPAPLGPPGRGRWRGRRRLLPAVRVVPRPVPRTRPGPTPRQTRRRLIGSSHGRSAVHVGGRRSRAGRLRDVVGASGVVRRDDSGPRADPGLPCVSRQLRRASDRRPTTVLRRPRTGRLRPAPPARAFLTRPGFAAWPAVLRLP